MPFSKEILMGAGAGGAASDPEDIGQTNFEAWFQSGTLATFTYEDSTYGNYLVLASPGGNTFYEHNSIKPSGFSGHSYIQWQINGYGWAYFALFKSTSTDKTYLNGQSGTAITTKTVGEFTAGYTYFQNGNNATSGNVYIRPYHQDSTGNGGTLLTVTGVTAKYYGDSNPTTFRAGIDDDGNFYNEVYHSGGNTLNEPNHDGDGWTKVGPYYMVESTQTYTTDATTSGIVNFGTSAYQFGWGNYDLYHVENMRRIVVRTNGD